MHHSLNGFTSEFSFPGWHQRGMIDQSFGSFNTANIRNQIVSNAKIGLVHLIDRL
jgi:hypothetical protein